MQVHNAYNTRFPFLFCMFEKITQHLVQYFAKLKNMQNIFFMKNGFIIWGASALRLSGPFGPAPHMMNSFFMKTKTIFAYFSVCKKLDWMLCNLFNHAKKVEFVCCERCDLARKIEFTFFELFEPVKNWIHLLLAFLLLQRIVWVINYSFWTRDKSDTNNSLSTFMIMIILES